MDQGFHIITQLIPVTVLWILLQFSLYTFHK